LGAADHASKALLCFIYSGIGVALLHLAQLADARKVFLHALELAKRIGDDARASIVAANLCGVEGGRGEYAEAIRYGQMSVGWAGTSSHSNPILGLNHSNLADWYVLTGCYDKALQCIETAETLAGPKPRWRVRCALLTERASFVLVQGNIQLALDLIGQLEGLAQGRESAFPLPGSLWKLKLFRAAHLGSADEALALASSVGAGRLAKCPYYCLDVLAARAWLERRIIGRQTDQTDADLEIFTTLGLRGKKALLTAQGFLTN
jgi:tetratricopeptide (TPR) repeat protein